MAPHKEIPKEKKNKKGKREVGRKRRTPPSPNRIGGGVLLLPSAGCHAQDATLSSIWHEGLVRDRSASRRLARMDIVTSTCTEKKRYIYIELAYTRHKLH